MSVAGLHVPSGRIGATRFHVTDSHVSHQRQYLACWLSYTIFLLLCNSPVARFSGARDSKAAPLPSYNIHHHSLAAPIGTVHASHPPSVLFGRLSGLSFQCGSELAPDARGCARFPCNPVVSPLPQQPSVVHGFNPFELPPDGISTHSFVNRITAHFLAASVSVSPNPGGQSSRRE